MKLFVADGLEKASHTFLRSDLANLGDGWTAIDLETLSVSAANTTDRCLYWVSALWLIVRLAPKSIRLLANRRWKTVLHGLFIAARLLPQLRSARHIEIRCHFLAKAAIASYVIARIKGGSLTVVCHGSDLYSAPASFDIILTAANRVECVSFFAKGFVFGRLQSGALGKAVMRRNLFSANTAAFANDFLPKAPPAAKLSLRLVGIGRLVPQKDFGFALEVLAHLDKCYSGRLTFDLIGDGPLRTALEKQASQLGVSQLVRFHGELNHAATLEMLTGADGLLLPCLERNLFDADGLPVVFQEALSRGVPIFSRQAFGVSELVIPGVNGHAFEASATPREWADLMARVLGRFSSATIVNTSGAYIERINP